MVTFKSPATENEIVNYIDVESANQCIQTPCDCQHKYIFLFKVIPRTIAACPSLLVEPDIMRVNYFLLEFLKKHWSSLTHSIDLKSLDSTFVFIQFMLAKNYFFNRILFLLYNKYFSLRKSNILFTNYIVLVTLGQQIQPCCFLECHLTLLRSCLPGLQIIKLLFFNIWKENRFPMTSNLIIMKILNCYFFNF